MLSHLRLCVRRERTRLPEADVSLVEVDAQVIGKTGAIDGLQARDFIVRDNRRPMPIRYCFQEETPLDIFLLFET